MTSDRGTGRRDTIFPRSPLTNSFHLAGDATQPYIYIAPKDSSPDIEVPCEKLPMDIYVASSNHSPSLFCSSSSARFFYTVRYRCHFCTRPLESGILMLYANARSWYPWEFITQRFNYFAFFFSFASRTPSPSDKHGNTLRKRIINL